MKCHNRRDGYGEWICFCPEEGRTAKQALAGFWNGWIQPDEIRRVKALGNAESTTEEQAQKEIAALEHEASLCMGHWRNCQ